MFHICTKRDPAVKALCILARLPDVEHTCGTNNHGSPSNIKRTGCDASWGLISHDRASELIAVTTQS